MKEDGKFHWKERIARFQKLDDQNQGRPEWYLLREDGPYPGISWLKKSCPEWEFKTKYNKDLCGWDHWIRNRRTNR